jgi:hypothetical protein
MLGLDGDGVEDLTGVVADEVQGQRLAVLHVGTDVAVRVHYTKARGDDGGKGDKTSAAHSRSV